MARRRHGVGVLKWVGTGLCVSVAVAFVASLWWTFGYERFSGTTVHQLAIVRGMALSTSLDTDFPRDTQTFPDGWFAGRHNSRIDARCIWPKRFHTITGKTMTLVVPLWIPFIALLLPTLLLWHFDRRRPPPGHCRCGYNLTGLTSNRCPECGTASGATP